MAAGSGERMKSKVPKQFIEVNGVPILIHTYNRIKKIDNTKFIIVYCIMRRYYLNICIQIVSTCLRPPRHCALRCVIFMLPWSLKIGTSGLRTDRLEPGFNVFVVYRADFAAAG